MNQNKITSQSFFNAWVGTVQKRKEHLLKIWRKPKEFTATVKGSTTTIMEEVANKLDLLCYHNDYYSLDTVLYKQEDLVPIRPKGSYWFRDIRVAFEHENFFNSGLFQEVAHLLITNCDLKVLVTYPDDDGQTELENLHGVIRDTRHATKLSDEESFLIIFGSETGFLWEGYVFKKDNWKQI